MKDFKSLNVYLSNIAVMTTKLHNLHWNVEGRNFYQTHVYTEGLYDKFFDWYDEVAEAIKMRGEFPFASLKEYVANATVKELESKDYKDSEVLKLLVDDLKIFKNKAFEIREYSESEKDFITVDMFEEFISKLDKDIWFISSMIK